MGTVKVKYFAVNFFKCMIILLFSDGAQYIAVTYRLFKLGKIASQQTGPVEATYDGGIAGNTCQLKFDQNYIFHVCLTL